MVESRSARMLLRLATILVLLFIYVPLIILAIYAFNPSRIQAWPPTGFTLHWFGEALDNPAVRRGILSEMPSYLICQAETWAPFPHKVVCGLYRRHSP